MFTIPASALRALALFTSKDGRDDRLKHVQVTIGPEGLRAYGTDGKILAIYSEAGSAESFSRLIPASTIAMLPKGDGAVTVSDDGLGLISFGGATFACPDVDLTFPDVLRAIPTTTSGEAGQFDPAYLAMYAKAAGMLGARKGCNVPHIRHNGEQGAAILTCPGVPLMAVLMPIRVTGADLPAWLKTDAKADAA